MAEKDASARLRRAVKENNLFLVKRLIARTDMRNPDPGPQRYTSLAWAAVLGHEETFGFLLAAGHDDEELSKDVENNTILILLAELKPKENVQSHCCASNGHPDLLGAALRMAQKYYDRYPFILEWSNLQGKTALHVAALKGNEELVRMLCDLGADSDLPDNLGNTPLHYASAWGHIQVVQLLIERGCSYTAKNLEGFTASDYAYSYNTMSALQETARMQYEAKREARRRVFQQAAAASNGRNRVRSGSSGSRTTVTSDSGGGNQAELSSSYSSSSSQQFSATYSSATSRAPTYASPSLSHSSSFTNISPLPSTRSGSGSSSLSPLPPSINPVSVLSPVASRVLERDADAMAEYKKRNRSGSSGTQASDSKSQASSSGLPSLPTINGSTTHLTRTGTPTITLPFPLANRRLRPSVSAAQLRTAPIPIVTTSMESSPRNRAGTTPTSRSGQPLASPVESIFATASGSNSPLPTAHPMERKLSNRRAATISTRPNDIEENFTGPPSDYAIFPEPPPDFGRAEQQPSPIPTKSSMPSARRAAYALLSKPLQGIESHRSHREHRRGISTSELKS